MAVRICTKNLAAVAWTVSYDQSVSITNITGLTGFTTSKGNIGTTFMNLTENQGETVILTPVWKTDAIYSHSQWAAIWDNLSGNYKLGADLDLQNETITRIGMAQSSHSQGRSMVKIILSAILKRIRDFLMCLPKRPA